MDLKILLSKFCIIALIILLGCTKSEVGISGLTSLVKVTQEAAGTNCTSGGFKIETGIDKNKNSVLDTDEIQNTAYVCNGANGASGTSGSNGTNGTNGLTSLIKITAEPAGANCSAGGYRIDTGVDDNADGILQTSEIDNTIYVCNGSSGDLVNYGKATLVLAGDITDAEAAQIIASDLGTATQQIQIIDCSNLKTVDLSKLESAISIEVVGNDSLKTLDLSGLKSITGYLYIDSSPELGNLYFDALESLILFGETNTSYEAGIYSTKLTQLSFPSLTNLELGNIGFRIGENSNTLPQSISFPELTEIEGVGSYEIQVYMDDQSASLSMPKLVKIANASLSINGSFSSFSFPKLVDAGDSYLYISDVTDFSAPNLSNGNISVYGNLSSLSLPVFTQGSVSVSSDLLTTLSLPLLTQGSVGVSSNSLATFSIPKFTTGDVAIYNSALTTLTIPEWIEGSLMIGGGSGNNSLVSVSAPKLAALTYLIIQGAPNLSGLTLPTLTSFGQSGYNNQFYITGSSLSSTSVNAILANLVQITPAITNANIQLQMNPTAPPTGQGITDKQTLIDNGNNVTTD